MSGVEIFVTVQFPCPVSGAELEELFSAAVTNYYKPAFPGSMNRKRFLDRYPVGEIKATVSPDEGMGLDEGCIAVLSGRTVTEIMVHPGTGTSIAVEFTEGELQKALDVLREEILKVFSIRKSAVA